MALTVDRNWQGTVYTAAVLNTFWTSLVAAVQSQLNRSSYSTVGAWTISESDAIASSINRPEDLVKYISARLYGAGLATSLRLSHPSAAGKFRMVLFEQGRRHYGPPQRKAGATFPVKGWYDVTPGTPYTISTSGAWLDFNFGFQEDLVGFAADIELMIDRLNERAPVVVVTTSLAAYTATGSGVGKYLNANANGAINPVDGVTLAVGDRLLYAPTTAHADAGIYVVTTVGDGSTAWRITRAGDCDASQAVHTNVRVKVASGTAYGGKYFRISTTGTITLESTAMLWIEERVGIAAATRSISGAGAITAADDGKVILVTMGTYQIDLPAVSGLAGFKVLFRFLAGAGTITIDGSGAETVDGGANVTNTQNSGRWLWTDGSAWYTISSF